MSSRTRSRSGSRCNSGRKCDGGSSGGGSEGTTSSGTGEVANHQLTGFDFATALLCGAWPVHFVEHHNRPAASGETMSQGNSSLLMRPSKECGLPPAVAWPVQQQAALVDQTAPTRAGWAGEARQKHTCHTYATHMPHMPQVWRFATPAGAAVWLPPRQLSQQCGTRHASWSSSAAPAAPLGAAALTSARASAPSPPQTWSVRAAPH